MLLQITAKTFQALRVTLTTITETKDTRFLSNPQKMNPTLAFLLLCQLVLCTAVTSKKVCGRPPVTDGIDELGLKRVYEIGEQVNLGCERGYTPSKAMTARITCLASGEWTKLDLVCSPKMCPLPKPMQKPGFVEVPYKSVLNFSCDSGYVMTGANESVCLHDGTLSAPMPMCTAVSCPLPRAPKHGKIVYDDKQVSNVETQYGQSWTYECLPPRAPIGNERGSCLASGNVTEPPVCEEVSCSIPPTIENGIITFAVMREAGYKEKVKYQCKEHYVMDGSDEIQCQKTGNWSTMPVCRAPCKVNINRGRIFYNAKKIWIEDLKPNRVLHKENVVFYCLNKEKKCGIPVASQCIDGTLKTPECFKEPSKVEYNLKSKSLPSEIAMCPSDPTK
ncbi:beta-2-glycoprotein 1 isoform X1 [Esox lucius]|uniref:Beta-2-glycoprotein 1 n=1 Tax=Esox lucius TaxID=8010 RepID=A0A3P9A303_ESOLU|nr:beta-2-glycoprotein 1 isoform X1 [Esox lucius]